MSLASLQAISQYSLIASLNPQVTAGDIAIVQQNVNMKRQNFAFVVLVNVASFEEIRFTDNGWRFLFLPKFRRAEGIITWKAPVTGLTAGTVVTIEGVNKKDLSTNFGEVERKGNFYLSDKGDQIFAFQGTLNFPSFLYGLQNDIDHEWNLLCRSHTTSAKPKSLETGRTAIALIAILNTAYSGPTTGTKEQLLALIGDRDNWKRRTNTKDEPRVAAALFTVT